MTTIKYRILAKLQERPATTAQLADALHMRSEVLRIRMYQLKKAGFVVGARIEGSTGNRCRWSLAPDHAFICPDNLKVHEHHAQLERVRASLAESPATAAQVRERLGLSYSATIKYLNELLTARRIRRVGVVPSQQKGRPMRLWGAA